MLNISLKYYYQRESLKIYTVISSQVHKQPHYNFILNRKIIDTGILKHFINGIY